jgi:hypothetical protein
MQVLKYFLSRTILKYSSIAVLALFISFSAIAQQPTPIIFKPLVTPLTQVFHLEKAGLIAITNDRELQFWDENTKAYYGYFGVLPTSAFNYKIRLVEYIEAYKTVAVVWQEYTTPNNIKDTIYKDFLSVINLQTLMLAQPIVPNGMQAFIEYKYNKQIILPKFKNAESIYQYAYHTESNSFYTCDRIGNINVYKNAAFVKTIPTNIAFTKLLAIDTSNTYAILANAKNAQVKRIHLITEKSSTVSNLKFIKTCLTENWNYNDYTFVASFVKEANALVLVDSASRLQFYSATNHTIETMNFLPKNIQANIVSFQFNVKDSSVFAIIEQQSNRCERSLISSNLKTGITNTFNGGNPLQITSSFYGSSPSSLRLMISGISEQEIDLSTLSEKTNHFLVNSPNDNLALSAKWENGYVSVFKENLNQYKLKVFEFENNKSNLIYTQTIQLKPNEILAAIEAKKKWYITTQNNQPNNVYSVDFKIYDSLQNCIFKLPVHGPMQLMNTFSFEQRIFSEDGKYMYIKEYLGTHKEIDSCRLRVFSTSDFSVVKDISFIELSKGNIYKRYTVKISDSSEKLYLTQLKKIGANYLNYLTKYDLKSKATSPEKEFQLFIEPTQTTMLFYVQNIKISKGEEMVLWTGSVSINGTTPADNIYFQGIRGTMLNDTKNQWGINLNLFPEIENVLLFNNFVAVQLNDQVQLYKWQNNLLENFLTLIPVYNEKTVEASCLFVAYEKNGQTFNYYEKTGNDDCISFKLNNHSYRRSLFDLTFNRPDLILEQIPEHDIEFKDLFRKAVLKRGERITNKLQNFNPDELPFVQIKNTGYVGNRYKITLSIKSKQPINQIKVTINGTVVTKSTYMSMEFGETQYNLFETLSLGENAIEIVVVTKKGLESLPLRLIQNHNKPQEKPVLHVLVASVSNYKNTNANLPFAVKDGRDMAKLFKQQLNDTFFSHIIVDTLFNEQLNDYDIKKWLSQRKDVDPNDYVVVFYSGHGLLNNQKELQLATSFTQFEEAKNTIDFAQILHSLDEVPARQKLFLIDACHSGDLDKTGIEATSKNTNKADSSKSDSTSSKSVSLRFKKKQNNAFEAMQKIFSFSEKGNGTIVFSASGGMQVAYEGAKYQNGYFTYALKEALLYNKANELNNTGLWLNQLIKYTTKRVTEISNGQQTPNLRIAHPDINWRIK